MKPAEFTTNIIDKFKAEYSKLKGFIAIRDSDPTLQ